MGIKQYFDLAKWKNEGYCDFIAKSSTISGPEETKMICENTNPKSYSYYRLAVEYLIGAKGLSMKEIITQKFSYEKVIDSVKSIYCDKEGMRP